MSVKKYRLYLAVVAIVLTAAVVVSIYCLTKEEEQYRDGLLVQNECVLEEEVA